MARRRTAEWYLGRQRDSGDPVRLGIWMPPGRVWDST
jgi:hypothetical protein